MEHRVLSQDGSHMIAFADVNEASYYQRFGDDFKIDVNVYGVMEEAPEDGIADEPNDVETAEIYVEVCRNITQGSTDFADEDRRRTATRELKNGAVIIEITRNENSKKTIETVSNFETYVSKVIAADKPKRAISGSWSYVNPKYL